MPRKSSTRNGGVKIEEETVVATIVTPKKGRKVVKVETVETVTQSASAAPAKAPKRGAKKAREVEEEVKEETKENKDTKQAPAKIKINSVKGKAVLEEEDKPKQKKTAKRKAKVEDDEPEDPDETKTKKKRKTKEEKEAEAMPVAARTAVATLRKAMHIGAHVSGAGGKYLPVLSSDQSLMCLLPQVYTTPSITHYTSVATRSPYSSSHSENGPVLLSQLRHEINSRLSV